MNEVLLTVAVTTADGSQPAAVMRLPLTKFLTKPVELLGAEYFEPAVAVIRNSIEARLKTPSGIN